MRLPQVRLSQYRRDEFLEKSTNTFWHAGEAQVRIRRVWPATTSQASPMAKWAAILSGSGDAGLETCRCGPRPSWAAICGIAPVAVSSALIRAIAVGSDPASHAVTIESSCAR